MKRVTVALLALLSLGASATSLRPISILVKVGTMNSEFPSSHLDAVRKSIARELENGHVLVFTQNAFFNNSVEICVQAEGYALGRLESAFAKLPVLEDGFQHSLSSNPCEMIGHSAPVPR